VTKILVCVPNAPGPTGFGLRCAEALTECGISTLFSSEADQLSRFEIPIDLQCQVVPPNLFSLHRWGKTEVTIPQYNWASATIQAISPDGIIVSEHLLGVIAAAIAENVPTVVIGGFVPITPGPRVLDETWKNFSSYAMDAAVESFEQLEHGLSLKLPDLQDAYTNGKWTYLLQGCDLGAYETNLNYAGFAKSNLADGCTVDLLDDDILMRCIYLQLGGPRFTTDFLKTLLDDLASINIHCIVDTARLRSNETRKMISNCNNVVLSGDGLEVDRYIPIVASVVTTGHPLVTLSAINYAKPLYFLPDGSGTDEISFKLRGLGIAEIFSTRSLSASRLDARMAPKCAMYELRDRLRSTSLHNALADSLGNAGAVIRYGNRSHCPGA
jgi:hypothetical protein